MASAAATRFSASAAVFSDGVLLAALPIRIVKRPWPAAAESLTVDALAYRARDALPTTAIATADES